MKLGMGRIIRPGYSKYPANNPPPFRELPPLVLVNLGADYLARIFKISGQ
jgi:hypothetical protein